MKKLTTLFFAATIYAFSAAAQDADPALNISAASANIIIGEEGVIELEIVNNGFTTIAIGTLYVDVNMATGAEIIAIDAPTSSAAWTIYSLSTGSGNTIRLINTGGPLTDGETQIVNLRVEGLSVADDIEVNGEISYASPAAEAQGNFLLDNDASATTVDVIADPLPLQLISFGGSAEGCNAALYWTTMQESRLKHYTVQGSEDGHRFSNMHITAAQNAHHRTDYHVALQQQLPLMYYRLKISEEDGLETYSKTVAVRTDCNTAAVNVYPNPATDAVTVTGVSAGMQLLVVAVDGRVVSTQTAIGNTAQMSLRTLAPGAYMLRITDSNGTAIASQQLIKQ